MKTLQIGIIPNQSGQQTLSLLNAKNNLKRRPNRSDIIQLIETNRHLERADLSRCEGQGECIQEGGDGGMVA